MRSLRRTRAEMDRRVDRRYAHEDARDTDPVELPSPTAARYHLLRLAADGRRTLLLTTTRTRAVILAAQYPGRCLVVARDGTIDYDNRKDG